MKIEFDGEVAGITLRFNESEGLERGRVERGTTELLWAREVSLEMIEEVLTFVGSRRLPVQTVVLTGLRDYPVGEQMLARWLVRAARKAGEIRIVVETMGLNQAEKERLIALTRREEGLMARQVPFGGIWRAWGRNWKMVWNQNSRRER